MKEILEETHGVMVYQEQVMRILNRLGGIELSNAYTCIKAISKKKLATIAKFREEFIAGAVDQGPGRKARPKNCSSMIEKFAGYGFNKSHSTAYALIAYMTAYLKAHYPVEFMAALLSGDIAGRNFKKKDSLVEHLEDCRRMNIEVAAAGREPLATATSPWPTAKSSSACRPSRAAAAAAAAAIVGRAQGGRAVPQLVRFLRTGRSASRSAARRIETLIKAGAFDSLGAPPLAAGWRSSIGPCRPAPPRWPIAARGQKGLFESIDDEPAADRRPATCPTCPNGTTARSWPARKKCSAFTSPAIRWPNTQTRSRTYCSHTHARSGRAAPSHRSGAGRHDLGHQALAHQESPARQHQHQVRHVRPGRHGADIMRCIVWPEEYANFGQLVAADAILVVRGAVDRRPGSEEANLIVNELIPLDQLAARYTRGLEIRLAENDRDWSGWKSSTKSSAATPATAACNWSSRWPTARKWRSRAKTSAWRSSRS